MSFSMEEEGQGFVQVASFICVCLSLHEVVYDLFKCIWFVLLQLQQLLTDLPHDMLEDSGDQLSSYSDSSTHESEER